MRKISPSGKRPEGYFSLNDLHARPACKIQKNNYHHGNGEPSLTSVNVVGVFDLQAPDASECQNSLNEK